MLYAEGIDRNKNLYYQYSMHLHIFYYEAQIETKSVLSLKVLPMKTAATMVTTKINRKIRHELLVSLYTYNIIYIIFKNNSYTLFTVFIV